jgi:hypothetical protein
MQLIKFYLSICTLQLTSVSLWSLSKICCQNAIIVTVTRDLEIPFQSPFRIQDPTIPSPTNSLMSTACVNLLESQSGL